ncbi:hypothetical protein AN640_01155 [Candidatus Epulonipiscium fishelsonii]|uniref:Uncharacterized protein n=1 Tax=Candidatus Epulonipiscium fishelsonii TaxID=77094 RepID=A0ACC8XHZ0_9FIRM|nr:hypothetical protein AN640_01155 [Epulopiscium sp. SCG-D08WGA-EpuloA1]
MEFKVLCPEYVKEFNCLGNSCKYNCCREWRMDVSNKEYEYYNALPSGEFKERIMENLVKTKTGYCWKCSETTGVCGLLNKDNLCEVYINLSPEEMPYICRAYPRRISLIKGDIEVALDLSCIEAVKLLFSHKEDLNFILTDFDLIEIEGKIKCEHIMENKENNQDFYLYNHYEDLNSFCVKVLKYKKLPLDVRFMILGLFIQQIDSQPESIDLIIKEYEKEILNGGFDNIKNECSFKDVFVKQLKLSVNIVIIILQKYKAIVNNNFKIKKLLGDYLEQLRNFIDDYSAKTVESNFKIALEKYNQYMATNNYIIENYIVNEIFTRKFPFDLKSGYNSYINLIAHYLIIKSSLLVSFYHYKDDIKLDNIIDNIMLLHRLIIRGYGIENSIIEKQAINYLEKNNSLDLISLFELILE